MFCCADVTAKYPYLAKDCHDSPGCSTASRAPAPGLRSAAWLETATPRFRAWGHAKADSPGPSSLASAFLAAAAPPTFNRAPAIRYVRDL